jgi:hypothetical protein
MIIINAGIIIVGIHFTIITLLKSIIIETDIFLKNNISKIYANKGANCMDVIIINLLCNINFSKITANVIKRQILRLKIILWFIFDSIYP